jgi:hypothetical protein
VHLAANGVLAALFVFALATSFSIVHGIDLLIVQY